MQVSQTVQNLSPQQLMAMMQSETGAMAVQTEGGDFFSLLLQMISGLTAGEGNADVNADALLSLLQVKAEDGEDSLTDAMQMMAGMLDPTLLGLDSLQPLPDTAEAAMDNQMVQLISSFAGVDSQKAQQLYLLMQAADDKAAQQAGGAAGNARGAKGEAAPEEQAQNGFLEILSHSVRSAAEAPKSEESSLQFGGSFRQAVAQAQKQLKSQEEGPEETVDVESLQSFADTRRGEIREARSAAAREDMSPPQPLTEQVRTGVLQGLSQGRSEFTVKLRPEGLGEITVRLTEGTDGTMTLNLTASTSQTARLLNQELEGLKEVLRPYGTEVTPAVTEAQESANADGGYTGAQFDAHQGQHAFYGQQSHAGGPMRDFVFEDDSADTELPEADVSGVNGRLNAYV